MSVDGLGIFVLTVSIYSMVEVANLSKNHGFYGLHASPFVFLSLCLCFLVCGGKIDSQEASMTDRRTRRPILAG